MNAKKILLILAIVTAPGFVCAQSGNILTQNRAWITAKGFDLISNDSVTVDMEFKTFSTDRIEHKGPNGHVQIFDITGSQGTWSDIGQPGMMTYQVSINNASGQVVIERTAGKVFLTVDMSGAGGIKIKFIINSIE